MPGPGHDEEALQAALAQEDDADRARALTQLLVESQEWVGRLSVARDEAVRAMRSRRASYDEVARVLGVSKSRAQQICQRLERDRVPAARTEA